MIREFINYWFPKTKEWDNIARFILESGIQITNEVNGKWLVGYTNICQSSKPHHTNVIKRHMEEQMFMLHDVIHQIFTMDVDTDINEEEYVLRQMYGELMTFYLTEYQIHTQKFMDVTNLQYLNQRGCYPLMKLLLDLKPTKENIIQYMWDCFIDDSPPMGFEISPYYSNVEADFKKYSKMFKEDLVNSKNNFKFVPKNIKSYCMVGPTTENHLDFFLAVSKGAIKNIKREFNIELPNEWI
jgi:hypothetical protein